MPALELEIVEGPAAGRRIVVDRPVVFGRDAGVDVEHAIAADRYISFDAAELLDDLMVDGAPQTVKSGVSKDEASWFGTRWSLSSGRAKRGPVGAPHHEEIAA